jgi:hypothetical protein
VKQGFSLMDKSDENLLKIGFAKALILSSVSMLAFVVGVVVIGMPMDDPLLRGFLLVMVVSMPFVFAGGTCFMGRCKVEEEGLRGAVPWGYQRVIRWTDITRVSFKFPFYVVYGGQWGEFCFLPSRFLLKEPKRLNQLVGKFAPSDNILRRRLGLDSERPQ